jgi:hypothetical protein
MAARASGPRWSTPSRRPATERPRTSKPPPSSPFPSRPGAPPRRRQSMRSVIEPGRYEIRTLSLGRGAHVHGRHPGRDTSNTVTQSSSRTAQSSPDWASGESAGSSTMHVSGTAGDQRHEADRCRDRDRAQLPVPRRPHLPCVMSLERTRLGRLLLGHHVVDLPYVGHRGFPTSRSAERPCDASTRTVVGRMCMIRAACSELYPRISVRTIAVRCRGESRRSIRRTSSRTSTSSNGSEPTVLPNPVARYARSSA